MPLPRNARPGIETRKILLTSNGVAEAAGVHRDHVLRALAQGAIAAAAWADYRGRLSPLFDPQIAVQLVCRVSHRPTHQHTPPIFT